MWEAVEGPPIYPMVCCKNWGAYLGAQGTYCLLLHVSIIIIEITLLKQHAYIWLSSTVTYYVVTKYHGRPNRINYGNHSDMPAMSPAMT